MRYLNHFTIFGLLLVLVALSGCSAGRRAFSRGEDFEAKGMYEEAMYSYADAFRHDPEAGEYRVRFLDTREQAANGRF
jgi:general secretion pathway protein D